MKFGRNFHKHQIPSWADSYLDYNGLKRQIKLAQAHPVDRGEAAASKVVENVSHEIDAVQAFYHKTYTALWDEVATSYMSLDFLKQECWETADRDELRYFLGIFIQCRSALKDLQWYGAVNAHGFRRLLQKVHPLMFNGAKIATPSGIELKLSSTEFSSQGASLYDLQCLQSSISAITHTLSRDLPTFSRSLILDHFVTHSYPSLANSNVAYNAIHNDDGIALGQFIRGIFDSAPSRRGLNQQLIFVFLQLSIICGSEVCIKQLLLVMESMHEENFSAKDYLPLVVIKILTKMGHAKMLSDLKDQSQTHTKGLVTSEITGGNSTSLLSHILAGLNNTSGAALLTQDPFFKRLPLHYAARYRLLEACQLLLNYMQGAKIYDSLPSSESVLLQDCFGSYPLKLAVTFGYVEISKLLLEFYTLENPSAKSPGSESWDALSGPLLASAVKFSPETLEYLLATPATIDHQGVNGETALYIAARCGDEESVKILLSHKAKANIREKVYGRTPLLVASVEGYTTITKLLINAGGSQEDRDLLGWTIVDHAAFRGHIELAKKLRESLRAESSSSSGRLARDLAASTRAAQSSRIPINESLILVNLGSLNSHKKILGVDLSPYLSTDESTIDSGASFSIKISSIDVNGASYAMELPILGDMTNEPFSFSSKDPSNAKLMFQIRRKKAAANKTVESVLVGSGVALLDCLKQGLGPTRESLIRDFSIPILARDTLENIGTITFSFLVIKPFSQKNRSIPARNILWKDIGPTKIVGHRGLGQNHAARKSLSIGENTIQSFLAATKLGAAWVELDVQLTKDHVPVVYHDFLVSETGTDAWMHHISLDKLMHISKAQSKPVSKFSDVLTPPRSRSHSLDTSNDHKIVDLRDRMKHTFEFKGFKSNTRGNCIHDSFITLRDLLSKTPDSLPLNIEIKYPMLFEAADEWKSDLFAIELNLFVDTILSAILAHPSCHSRPIMFSSFSPEICILTSLKQVNFPIFFLSESGSWPTGDVRASSFQEALHFAKRWNLDGVVMASEPFVYAPELVGVAKERGLVTASYGALNNDPECAKVQADAGLDIIIVDAVRLISETLGGKR